MLRTRCGGVLWAYYRLDIVPAVGLSTEGRIRSTPRVATGQNAVGATKFSSIGMESFDGKMDCFLHTLFDVPGYGFDRILSECFNPSTMLFFLLHKHVSFPC